MFQEIIRYCLLSSVLKPIKMGEREYRAQINVLLNAPFGTGKTDLMTLIERKGLGRRIMNWTVPALVGSISSKGQIVPPMTIEVAGKTGLIDEYQAIPLHMRMHLLQLLEEQTTTRMLSRDVGMTPIQHEGKYFRLYARHGYLTFQIRASYIICTARVMQTHTDKMLQSRCVQVNVQMTYDDLRCGISNLKLDDIQELRAKLDGYQGEVKKEKFDSTLEHVVEEMKARGVEPNYAYRVTWDILRIDNINRALDIKNDPLRFLDFILDGIVGGAFTPMEFRIYEKLRDGKSKEEIMKELGVPEKYFEEAKRKWERALRREGREGRK
jgi:hypothetical protein